MLIIRDTPARSVPYPYARLIVPSAVVPSSCAKVVRACRSTLTSSPMIISLRLVLRVAISIYDHTWSAQERNAEPIDMDLFSRLPTGAGRARPAGPVARHRAG